MMLLHCANAWTADSALKDRGRLFVPQEFIEKKIVELDTYSIEIFPGEQNGSFRSQISGKLLLKDATFLINDHPITQNNDGKFRFSVTLTGPSTTFRAVIIHPEGEVDEQSWELRFADYAKNAEKPIAPAINEYDSSGINQKTRYYLIGIGPTSLSYSEVNSFTTQAKGLAMTGKASIQWIVKPPRWSIGLSVFGTLFPISSTLTSSAAIDSSLTAKFFGANFRIGLATTLLPDPWKISFFTGVYYTTMFGNKYVDAAGNPNGFGFSGLMGPQLFPVIRRSLKGGDALSMYLKYSPIAAGGFSLSNLGNRELATGLTWSRAMSRDRVLAFTLDYANLSILIDDVNLGLTQINSSSISLGVGLGW